MPIDWEDLEGAIDVALEESSAKTDTQLAARISSITRMTDDEVKELFPRPADLKRLSELMRVVKSAETRNNKVNHIVKNAEELGGVVLTLLEKFA